MGKAVLIAALLISACAATGQVPRRAPGFSLPDSAMRQHDLQDYRGKVVLIEIMKTNCPGCRAFTTVLEQVKAKYAGRVVVLSIVHPPDDLNAVKAYIQQNNVTSPILFDCGQMAASYVRRATIDVPHLFVVDGNGMIQGDYGHETDKEIFQGKALYALIDRLLKAK
mgnify:CR=1 FL=1